MTDWTSLQNAPALLASMAQNPPRQASWRTRSGDTNEGVYVGARVRLLNEIHRAESKRLLRIADETRDYRAWNEHDRLSVQVAIQDAIRARSLGGATVEKEAA